MTHVLILAVDQFGYKHLKCNKDSLANMTSGSGIEALCQDSIRFTHAYTTSQQTRPAITSILTAQYPFSHRVQDNDISFLEAKMENVAKTAAEKGFETAFIIGSPFTLRNSGLQNGFHFFDDSYLSEKMSPYRYFNETKNIYLNWRLRQKKPTFALIHISDLFFKKRPTQTELGEQRNYSYESQLEEFDSNLFQLIKHLKAEQGYDNTLLILVGLNSSEINKTESQESINFNQDQIALLIKPPHKPRDLGLSWTYDENVSLTDIGRSLFDFLNAEGPKDQAGMETISILPNGLQQHPSRLPNRWTVSETYSHFQGVPPYLSLRKEQFHLILSGNQIKIYNTLIDKFETTPLSHRDPLYQELSSHAQNIIQQIQKKSSPSLNLNINEDLTSLKKIWTESHPCLNEIKESSSNIIKFKSCRDKRILFLAELLRQKHPLTELQRRKIQNFQNDLNFILSAHKINQEIGSPQIQPLLEYKRWRPFMAALQHPTFSEVQKFFTKPENR